MTRLCLRPGQHVIPDIKQPFRALRELTHELDVEVFEAQTRREAIQQTGELQPDLIVLDLSMPVMNGLEAARVIKI